jgi:hypothetical protein
MRKEKFTQKKADDIFSLIVRHRGTCQAKGLDGHPCKGRLECAHIITRGAHKLRFSENNALALCHSHHFFYTNHPHLWYWEFIPKHFPKQYAYTQLHKNELLVERVDFEELITRLRLELDSLQADEIGI